MNYSNEKKNEELRERSGSINVDSYLVSFLYQLMRDHVTPGVIEQILRDSESISKNCYTNGWLAEYAKDVAIRLKCFSENDTIQKL